MAATATPSVGNARLGGRKVECGKPEKDRGGKYYRPLDLKSTMLGIEVCSRIVTLNRTKKKDGKRIIISGVELGFIYFISEEILILKSYMENEGLEMLH